MTVTIKNTTNANLDSDDSLCWNIGGTTTFDVDDFAIGADVGTQVRVLMNVQAGTSGSSNTTNYTVYLAADGTNYCSGHTVSAVTDGTCGSASSISKNITCTHALGVPDNDAQADTSKIKITNTSGSSTNMNRMRYELTHFALPGAPSNFSSPDANSPYINLTWTAATGTITGYKFDYKKNGDISPSTVTVGNVTTYAWNPPLDNTEYRLENLRAYNDGGDGANSGDVIYGIMVKDISGLSATNGVSTEIDISWTDPGTFLRYSDGANINYTVDLQWDDNSGYTSPTNLLTDSSLNTYNHTGLTDGNTYYYRVRVKADRSAGANYTGGYINTSQTAAGPPDTPTGLTETSANTTSVNISWTDGSDNGSAITGHTILWERHDLGTSGSTTTTTATTATISGLVVNTEYNVRVRAENSIGNSAYTSNVVMYTRPSIPTNLTVSPSLTVAGRMDISWSAVSEDHSISTTTYSLWYSSTNAWAGEEVELQNTSATSYIHTGLGTNTTAYYKVKAINSGPTNSALTSAVSNTTTSTPTAPGTPTVNGRTTSSIEITWTAGDGDGATITDYEVQWRVWDGTFATVSTGTDLLYNKTSLIQNTKYEFQVRTLTAIGTSLWSASGIFYTVPSIPNINAVTSTVIGLQPDWNAITINKPVADGVVTYDVQRADDTAGTNQVTVASTITAILYDDTVSGNGVTRYYRTQASNDQVSSGYTTWLVAVGGTTWSPPSEPGNTTYSSGLATEILFAWTTPSSDGGESIDGYKYGFKIHGGTYSADQDEGLVLSTTHGDGETNLVQNTAYYFRVRAYNARGDGPYNVTSSRMYTQPNLPANTAVDADGDQQLTISWDAVAISTDNADVTTYTVTRSDTEFGTYTAVSTAQTALSYSDTALGDGVTKWYKVRAENVDDQSTYTFQLSATTWTVPGVPGDPSYTSGTTTQISFSWTAASDGGNPPLSYTYNWNKHGEISAGVTVGNVLSTTHGDGETNLVVNTKYYFSIYATNGAGFGSTSNTIPMYTTPGLPGNLTVLPNAVGQLGISWDAVAAISTDDATQTTYRLDASDDGSTGWLELVTQTGLSYNHSSLGNGVTKYYRVRAINPTAFSIYTGNQSETTWTIPGVPTGLNITVS